jgi:hypothetical protein
VGPNPINKRKSRYPFGLGQWLLIGIGDIAQNRLHQRAIFWLLQESKIKAIKSNLLDQTSDKSSGIYLTVFERKSATI